MGSMRTQQAHCCPLGPPPLPFLCPLQNLLKRFDAACSPSEQGGSAPVDLALLRFCAAVAADLPYKRGDEPCSVVHQVNGIVARRGAGVLEDFKAALQSQVGGWGTQCRREYGGREQVGYAYQGGSHLKVQSSACPAVAPGEHVPSQQAPGAGPLLSF